MGFEPKCTSGCYASSTIRSNSGKGGASNSAGSSSLVCCPVSLTQVTERGTVYTLEEIAVLAAIAREYGLKTHMDGARFLYAAALEARQQVFQGGDYVDWIKSCYKKCATDLGVDILSLGGCQEIITIKGLL